MLAIRAASASVTLSLGAVARTFATGNRPNFGAPRARNPSPNRQYRPPPQQQQSNMRFRGGQPQRPSEPQLVAKLIELFPVGTPWIPLSKWAQGMPDEVREALVTYGGPGNFASSQTNFFIVRTENGVKVVSLSPLGLDLCRERLRKERQDKKRAEKFSQRRGSGSPRGGRPPRQQRIQ